MVNIMISVLCTLLSGISPVDTPKDTLQKYVIDGKAVSGFDGSQLTGKLISSYVISFHESGENTVEKVHEITTSTEGRITISPDTGAAKDDTPIIVVDGKIMPREEFVKISPERIESITVYKESEKCQVTYDGKACGGILLVKTKDGAGSAPYTVFLDGKKLSKRESVGVDRTQVKVRSVEVADNGVSISLESK